MKNIVILEKIEIEENQKSRLNSFGSIKIYENSTLEECRERVKNADVVVIDWIEPNSFLENMKSGSLLALMSTGYSWIDIKKAKSLGISITNIPNYASEAVAEHLFGLILTILRGILISDRAIREKKLAEGKIRGLELSNKTLGIIGLGAIGRRMAEIGQGFDMNIITFNRTPKNFPGIKETNLEELLKNSDIVSINCDLNSTSWDLIGEKEIEMMKRTAILVSATWDVINLSALTKALKEKRILGAGLDVAKEGGAAELPDDLLGLDNIILTNHIAYNTSESQRRRVDICLDNIEKFLNQNPQNIVN